MFHCLRYLLGAHPPLRTASLCAPEFISLNKLTSVLLNGRIYVWSDTSNSFCSILLFLDGSCQSSDNYSSNLFYRFICPKMFQEIRMWVWGMCVCVWPQSYKPALSSFERQGASIEQPFNVTVNLLLFKKKFPLKKSSNKLAKLEMRPQFVLALNFRELLNKQKSMNSNNHKVISMINQVLKLV